MSQPPPGMTPAGVPEEVAHRLSNGLPIDGMRASTAPTSAERARQQAALDRWKAERELWVAACREQLSTLSLPARIACVMTVAAREGLPADVKFSSSTSLINDLAPELGVADEAHMMNPPWDDREIAAWFGEACRERAQRLRLNDRKTRLGRWKEQFTTGWEFDSGSTVLYQHNAESRWLLNRGVSSDGRALYASGARLSFEPSTANDRFNPVTLKKMAHMARLAPLPTAPPRPD